MGNLFCGRGFFDDEKPHDQLDSPFPKLNFSIKSQYSQLPKKAGKDVQCMVYFKFVPEKENQTIRAPIDLICVVDKSNSMKGQKLFLLKRALKLIVNKLGPSDRLCLIEFDHETKRLCPLILAGSNKGKLEAIIDQIKQGGGTNMQIAMTIAIQVLNSRRHKNPIASIFMLTDGNQQSGRVANINSQLNFSINCFGFGHSHDSAVLRELANKKNGNYFYIEQLQMIQEAFAIALGGLESVVATDVILNLYDRQLVADTTNTHFWQKQIKQDAYQIKLDQVSAQKQRGFMFKLKVPPINRKCEILALSAQLVCRDSMRKHQFKFQTELKLQINQSEMFEPIQDGQVMQNLFRIQAANAIERARQLNAAYQYNVAQVQLQKMQDQIKNHKNLRAQKMRPVLNQINELKEFCQAQKFNPQQFVNYGHGLVQQSAVMQCEQTMNACQQRNNAMVKQMKRLR